MRFKHRLNLITTVLLILILLAGTILNVFNARHNVHAEVASTQKLVLRLLDEHLHQPHLSHNKPFDLEKLQHIRHLRIAYYSPQGVLLDSNRVHQVGYHSAPSWFMALMNVAVAVPVVQRRVYWQGEFLGKLQITPDPSYEYAEIWKQVKDLWLLLLIFFVALNVMISWVLGQALKPTSTILATLNRLEGGDLQARMPKFRLPELASIGRKFNHMLDTLEHSIGRNHRLSQQLITLQEAERKHLARELHDEFGQCLAAIQADASVIHHKAEHKCPELQDNAHNIMGLSRKLMELLSGLLQNLRSSVLDELGLVPAIQDLVRAWQARNQTVQCVVQLADDLPQNLSETLQLTVYRLVQELLTNIERHAQASKVHIELTWQTPQLCLRVQDNGCGFEVQKADGLGLLGMRERVEGVGGQFTLSSQIGRGTTVVVCLPYSVELA